MKTEEQRISDELFYREERTIGTPVEESKSKKPSYPDAKKHQIVSFIKSGIRILACFIGSFASIEYGFFLLAAAEVVGVVEELV